MLSAPSARALQISEPIAAGRNGEALARDRLSDADDVDAASPSEGQLRAPAAAASSSSNGEACHSCGGGVLGQPSSAAAAKAPAVCGGGRAGTVRAVGQSGGWTGGRQVCAGKRSVGRPGVRSGWAGGRSVGRLVGQSVGRAIWDTAVGHQSWGAPGGGGAPRSRPAQGDPVSGLQGEIAFSGGEPSTVASSHAPPPPQAWHSATQGGRPLFPPTRFRLVCTKLGMSSTKFGVVSASSGQVRQTLHAFPPDFTRFRPNVSHVGQDQGGFDQIWCIFAQTWPGFGQI